MVQSHLIDPSQFRERLTAQITKYRRLTTPLAAPGNHKGPPLYGGGALVAFCWDIQIRNASLGKRNLGHFMKTMWAETSGGKRPYAWENIRRSLDKTTALDWQKFYRRYIEGSEKLPLAETFRVAGLRIRRLADGSEKVEVDENASPRSRKLMRSITQGR